MIKLSHVLTDELILALVTSTIKGIKEKDGLYDQLHYINRKFVDSYSHQLRDILAKGLSVTCPGISRDDFAYVNDFIAPVN